MNTFNQRILVILGLSLIASIAYNMELRDKDYYKAQFMRTIEHRNENPADWAKRQLNHVVENSVQWQALQEIIQENSTQTITTIAPQQYTQPITLPTPKNIPQHTASIWVKTSDNQIIEFKKWQIDEMRVLQLLLAHQHKDNSQKNPIILPSTIDLSFNDFTLISQAFDAAAFGNFDDFYDELFSEYQATLKYKELGEGRLRRLINIAQRLEANGISALFAKEFFKGLWTPENPLTVDIFREIQKYFIDKKSLVGSKSSIEAVTFSPNGQFLASSGWKPTIWNVDTGQKAHNLIGHNAISAFSPNSKYLASGSWDDQNNLIIWDVNTGQQLYNLVGHNKPIYSVTFSPNGDYLASGSFGDQNNLIIWDVNTGQQFHNLVGHNNVHSVAFSPNSHSLASGSWQSQNNLIIWNVNTGQPVYNLVGHSGVVNSVAFSPNGHYLASCGGGNQNNLIIWDTNTGQQLHNLVGHTSSVEKIAFSPDSNYLASGSNGKENNLILWDVNTGQQLHNLVGHNTEVESVVFSPNGQYLASCSKGKKDNLILWNVNSGQQLHNLVGHTSWVTSVSFSPNNQYLASGSYDKQNNLILWNLNPLKINDFNLEQIQALYQWVLAAKAGYTPHITQGTRLYAIYQSLPGYVKNLLLKTLRLKIERTQRSVSQPQYLNE